MREQPISGLLSLLHNRFFDLAYRLRNAESLRRLEQVVQRYPLTKQREDFTKNGYEDAIERQPVV